MFVCGFRTQGIAFALRPFICYNLIVILIMNWIGLHSLTK